MIDAAAGRDRARCAAAMRPLEPDADERARARRPGARPCARLSATQVETAAEQPPGTEVFAQRLDPEFAEDGPRSRRRCSTMSAQCVDRPGLHHHLARASWPISRAAGCSIRRSATSSPPRRTNIRASPRPAPARCGSRMPAPPGWPSVIGYPRDGRRHADLGRQHRQSDRHRRRPRSARSGRRRRGLHHPLRPSLRRQGAAHRRPRPRAAAADRDRRSLPHVGRRARGRRSSEDRRRRHPALAGRRLGRHGRHRRDRSAAGDRRRLRAATAPGSTSTAPMAACSRCATRAGRSSRGIERADSVALDPHKTLFLPYGTGAVAGPRRHSCCRRVQRQRRIYPAARRVRGRPVAGRPVARADPPFPRAAPVAAAADRRRRRLPRRAVGKARARPLFPRPPVGDRRLRRRARRRTCRSSPSAIVPKTGDVDEFNERLLRHFQQEGRVMLSGTRIDGSYPPALRDPLLPHPSRACRRGDRRVRRGVEALDG